MISESVFPGEWCDVAVSLAGSLFARLDRNGPALVLERESGPERIPLPTAWGLYLRCALRDDGVVAAIYQDHQTGRAASYRSDSGWKLSSWLTFGQNAVEVTVEDGQFVEYVQVGPTTALRNGVSFIIPQTSQGFHDGALLTDAARFAVPGLILAAKAGRLALGQHPEDPPRLRLFDRDLTTYSVGHTGLAYEPRLVAVSATTWLGCARTPQGSLRLVLSPPFAPEGVPAPVPVPTPDPVPVPVPETHMELPDAARASRDRYVAKFPVPQGAPGDAIEEACRQWSRNLSQQVQFDTRDPKWGMKNAGGGRPTSKDTIAYDLGNGLIRIWDLISGAGTGQGRLVDNPQSEDISGQTFEPQPAVDHVGSGQPPGPGPTPDPTPTPQPIPGTDLTAVHAKLDAILAKLAGPFRITGGF